MFARPPDPVGAVREPPLQPPAKRMIRFAFINFAK
jgi:hypothetical protein